VVSTTNNDAAWQENHVQATEDNPSPDISFEDEALVNKGRVWIPDNWQRMKQIVEAEYNSKVTGHMGLDKKLQLV
jgi:hypothetical protein